MRIVVLQENIVKQLNLTSFFLPTKSVTPLNLNNFVLKAKQGTIKIFASNLETTIITNCPGKIEEEGDVALPAKTLLAVLGPLTGEKLLLETEKKLLKIKGKQTTIRLKTEPAEDFFKIEEVEKKGEKTFSGELIRKIKNQVCFAASDDASRAVLTGVLFEPEDGGLNIVATDGFRLSLLKKKIEEENIFPTTVLPSKALSNLAQIVKEEEIEKVRASFLKEKNQAVFLLAQFKIFTRVVEGEFPHYQKIIPGKYSTKIILNREGFLKTVRLSSIFARDAANVLKLKTNKDRLYISANSPQTGENKSVLEAKIEGEETEIAFNFRFLLDFLNSGEKEEVIIEINGPLNPGVFKFGGESGFLHLIMPVRLQES